MGTPRPAPQGLFSVVIPALDEEGGALLGYARMAALLLLCEAGAPVERLARLDRARRS